jgi:hypothetical protein
MNQIVPDAKRDIRSLTAILGRANYVRLDHVSEYDLPDQEQQDFDVCAAEHTPIEDGSRGARREATDERQRQRCVTGHHLPQQDVFGSRRLPQDDLQPTYRQSVHRRLLFRGLGET